MRLDKFLQTTGIIKRRELANEACKLSLVEVNGKTAKPTLQVKPGDQVEVNLARKTILFEVLEVPEIKNIRKSDRSQYINILKTDDEVFDPESFFDEL